jgi:hypothetical protein
MARGFSLLVSVGILFFFAMGSLGDYCMVDFVV